ncbi:VWA domain-containing protein [Atopobium fossor]|uniref:VWA domain-containing protein n=1 Tax=Atopobium fossor TaxID=39487 RepID=UPI0003FB902B|nr:VWA domain-containing protein [Atopobium fossor]
MCKKLSVFGWTVCLFVLTVFLVFTLSTPAIAAQPNDSLVVRIDCNKDSYAVGDSVLCHITIENPTNTDAKDIELVSTLPDGLVVQDPSFTSFHIDTIAAHTSYEKDVVCEVVHTSHTQDIPDTSGAAHPKTHKTSHPQGIAKLGDNFSIGILTALIAVDVICIGIAVWNKHKSSVFVLFIAAIGISLCLSNVAYAQPSTSQKLTVHTIKTITVEDRPCDIVLDTSYIWDTNSPTVAIDRQKLVSTEGLDGYGMPDDKTLWGTLDTKDKQPSSLKLHVYDDKSNEIGSYDIQAKQSWSINSFGLLRGSNTLTVTCTFSDGSYIADSVEVGYDKTDRLDLLSIDRDDTDSDGLINYLETYYTTDLTNKDTDADGIDDYIEIAAIHTDPTNKDSDNNGILDGDEDSDNDGLSNLTEIGLGINLASYDTDLDELDDGQEVNLGTNPLKEDSDSDGAWDGWEVTHNTDPLSAQKSFVVSATQTGPNNTTTLSATTAGAYVEQLYMLPITGTDIDLTQTPGYVCGYEFCAPQNFEEATIEFELDEKLFENKDFTPTVYYYNPNTQALEEQQTSVNGCRVSFKPTHFSIYLVLDKHSFDHVWNRDIKDPTKQDQTAKPYDFCFVLDESWSMQDTDPKCLRVDALNGFVDKFGANDRACVVSFAANGKEILPFTSDKALLHETLEKQRQRFGSGTNGRGALTKAMSICVDKSRKEANKVIFFLTDGDDNYTSGLSYESLAKKAQDTGVTIYCFVLGDIVSEDKYNTLDNISKASGGKCYRGIDSDMSSFTGLIFDETIDYETDSNGDGISDYYAKLIKSGSLTLANGTTPYKGIDFTDPDYDHDGFLNGQELKVCVYYSPDNNRYVYLKQISNPLIKESSHKVDSRTLAIFAALCYEDGSVAKREGRFYKQNEIVGNKNKEERKNPKEIGQSYYFLRGADIFDPGEDGHISQDWKIAEYIQRHIGTHYLNNEKIGDTNFSATVYVRGNDVVLAYRGTDENPEWINDFEGALINVNFEEPYANQMARLVAKKYAATGKNVYITGHSLGGYLAQVGAASFLNTRYKDQLKACEYFNGMGLDYALWAQFGSVHSSYTHFAARDMLKLHLGRNKKLISHRINGDFVSPRGIHSGITKEYGAFIDCIHHHKGMIDWKNLLPSKLLPTLLLCPESLIYIPVYGFNPDGELYAYAWTVHETDSFLYRLKYESQMVKNPRD